MNNRFLRHLFLPAFLVATTLLPRPLHAQTTAATISGQIVDSAGALVRGAQVELKSTLRGTSQTATTNSAGIYVFPTVDPGPYSITVRRQGFRQVDLVGLVANVQDHIEQNFKLEVGSVTESVTVEGNSININKSDGSVSTVVDAEMVKNMPLNGRSFQDLILLTPGVVTNTPQSKSIVGRTGEFSVNGQRTEENYYTVDGVSANVGANSGFSMINGTGVSGSVASSTALGTTQSLVSVDDLQEFRVQSSTYSAEYGRNPGGQFAFETKSGSNQVHGTAYDYLRNDYFDANDWFNDYLGKKEPPLRQNDFGGTIGAPVRIPWLYNGKDKTFFFVSYEGLRLVAPQPATSNFVPDLCMRGSAADCASLNAQYEGTSAGAAIGYPANGRSPAASALLPVVNAFPRPTPSGLEDPANGIGQFIGTWSNPSSINSTSVRFDHVLNDKSRIFFRFSDTTSSALVRTGSSAAVSNASAYVNRTYTGGMSTLFSNRFSNDFRLNYSSNESTQNQGINAFGGSTPVNLRQLLGLGPGSEPSVGLNYGGYGFSLLQNTPSGAQRQWNLIDKVSVSVGRHQFSFGVDYRRLTPFAAPPNPLAQYFYTSENGVESNFAEFVDTETLVPAHPLYQNFSAFAQDEWKISRSLTLSVGLRWEVNPPPTVIQGLMPYTLQGSSPDTVALAPENTPLWRTTWFNFAPRLGAAYIPRGTPGWETVLRGGGGVFYDTGQQYGSIGFQGPGTSAFSEVSGAFPVLPTIPTPVNPPVGQQDLVYAFAPHLQLPYTLQWNASVEQAMGKSQTVTLSYVASHASRLLKESVFSSSINPNVVNFYLIGNGLTSDYNSLQGQFRRRLSRGLTALASYTWAHCIDYGSSNIHTGYQRENCDFDLQHNFSAAFSYDLPSRWHSTIVRSLLGGWGVDDRFSARTAFPVNLTGTTTVDPLTGNIISNGLNFVPDQPILLYGANCASILQGLHDLKAGQGCPGGKAINPNAFSRVSGVGNVPRNFVRGFGAMQMDLAVRREFPIYENLRLQFRAEAFNLFNHPNFGVVNGSFGQKTFGQTTATLANSLGVLSPLYQMGGPRSMQFALKLVW